MILININNLIDLYKSENFNKYRKMFFEQLKFSFSKLLALDKF
jgi:hypothetical protein